MVQKALVTHRLELSFVLAALLCSLIAFLVSRFGHLSVFGPADFEGASGLFWAGAGYAAWRRGRR
jgi:hypothetical protein